jgi:hypothetical protein
MVTMTDLEWFLAKAAESDWTEAKTYADSAPHEYVVLDRTPGWSREDFVRAGELIRAYGVPGKFYSMTNIYLEHDGVRYWTMDPRVEDTDLINRADATHVYGRQDAPSTDAPEADAIVSTYNRIGPEYERMWTSLSDHVENRQVRELITGHFAGYAPQTLDIGCGTGLLLDLAITSPLIYTGVDPSRAMLNELVMKHPKVREVIPARLQDARLTRGSYDLVACLFAAASYLRPEDIRALPSLVKPGGLLIGMCYEPGYFPDYYNEENPPPVDVTTAAHEAWNDLGPQRLVTKTKIGRFDVTMVKP